MTVEELKDLLKQCKEDEKNILKGKPKYFYLAQWIDTPYEFLIASHWNNMKCMKAEHNRAWAFLTNTENTTKYGLYDKKEKPELLKEFASLAYPNINLSIYENKFEQEYIIQLMKES